MIDNDIDIKQGIACLLKDYILGINEIYLILRPVSPNISKISLQILLDDLVQNSVIRIIQIKHTIYYCLTHAPYNSTISLSSDYRNILQRNMEMVQNRKLTSFERNARLCYKHLAGKQGIILFNFLLRNNYLTCTTSHAFLTPLGKYFFTKLNIGQYLAQQSFTLCLDYTHRQWHLGGILAKILTQQLIDKNFISKDITTTRGLIINEKFYNSFT